MNITITNKLIYDKICELEKHVIQTNGKVKLNKWIATTALAGLLMWVSSALVTATALI